MYSIKEGFGGVLELFVDPLISPTDSMYAAKLPTKCRIEIIKLLLDFETEKITVDRSGKIKRTVYVRQLKSGREIVYFINSETNELERYIDPKED